ncbi:MAG TPA: glutamate--cysteine ligase [Mycobacteriales bacterium]|nr:glutamate--cysteine ligase [Mycobacteriales bacterium]
MHIDFMSSERSSLGVEVELEVVDQETRELHSGGGDILREMNAEFDGSHPKAKHELLESTIEIITGICTTVDEARRDLESTLADVTERAEKRGLALMCSGTHPFSDWKKQQITPNERYARLVENMQWLARRMQIFGIHVHVGVRSPDKVIPIVNALSTYIPQFLALSSSSPYWMGQDTGLASSRSKVFEGLPTAGLPHQLAGWTEFEDYMSTLINAETISSVREVWWDVRPHPGFGTVEIRICDGLPRMSEIATVAAIGQCLVDRFNTLIDRGYKLPVQSNWILRENKWRAARYGLSASIILDEKGNTQPLVEAIAELVDELRPVADKLGCTTELMHALTMIEEGPSYLRQRNVVAQGGTLVDVVDSLVEEMRTDKATPLPQRPAYDDMPHRLPADPRVE